MTPELSVVIPSRNRWPLLRRALGCALDQRDVDLEVLIIDDGSTDGSAERAETIADPRVTVLRRARLGVAAARNLGIEEARAPWIALLDDDDLWAPGKSRFQLDQMAQHAAEISYTGQAVVDESLAVKRLLEAPPPEGLAGALLGSNVIGTPSSVISRRDAFLALGGFDTRFSVLADWDMWLRLCARHRAVGCPQLLVAYVEHAVNLHVVDTASVLRESALLRSRHQAAAGTADGSFGDVNWWRWIASSHRRAGRRGQAAGAYLRTGVRFRSPRDVARALAVLGGEGVMGRLAGSSLAPDPARSHEWEWLDQWTAEPLPK